ncbi:DUF4041 domain-containing protein [Cellulophaga baltica]|uniref:DUF4041 domain-containing protein n=1 Tax=Cellulophaga baltica TaxID=76594 RepID=UPI0024955547|nr:DUF4041 domain-containing protein [Cellulophaga baltica]
MTLGLIITIFALGITLFIVINQCKEAKTKLNSEIKNKNGELSRKIEENNKLHKKIENINSELSIKKKENEKLNSDLERFSAVISIENEIESKSRQLTEIQTNAFELNNKFINAKSTYKELEKDIKLYKNDIEFLDFGVYEPFYNFETTEKFKDEIGKNYDLQKELVKSDEAIILKRHPSNELVEINSFDKITKEKFINTKKLIMLAFNTECNYLISKTNWNNISSIIERIDNHAYKIFKFSLGLYHYDDNLKENKLATWWITEEYKELKIKEAKLHYEHKLKIRDEKEAQREIRAQIREEERAQREFEKARKDAEIEEKHFQKAIERAKKELGLVSGEKLDQLNLQISELEQSLKNANEAKERAISRAQETKSGHVYIISNLGSFGENVYKIGMTRRLDPIDRIKELGNASVPFTFDLHAMIFSENAPELESLLHKEFDDRRINKVNNRKEYFKVTLDEIEQVVKDKYDKEVDFIKTAEAQQFRETKTIIKQIEHAKNEQVESEIEKYPDSLF